MYLDYLSDVHYNMDKSKVIKAIEKLDSSGKYTKEDLIK